MEEKLTTIESGRNIDTFYVNNKRVRDSITRDSDPNWLMENVYYDNGNIKETIIHGEYGGGTEIRSYYKDNLMRTHIDFIKIETGKIFKRDFYESNKFLGNRFYRNDGSISFDCVFYDNESKYKEIIYNPDGSTTVSFTNSDTYEKTNQLPDDPDELMFPVF